MNLKTVKVSIKMIKFNLHTHTKYCDGQENIEDMILGALKYNIDLIGITPHGPLPFETDWTMHKKDLEKYFKEVSFLKNKYKDKIEILIGMELDYLPDIKMDYIDTNMVKRLDFWIGSNHFLGKLSNGYYWTVDYSIEEINEGVKENFDGSIKAAVSKYYDYMKDMILNYEPTILGHLDLIKKNNQGNLLFNEAEDWYRDKVLEVINTLENSKTVVEVNTGGKYRGYSSEYYPSRWILEEMCSRKLPVTVSRDAHDIDSLNYDYEESISYLKEIGFNSIVYFKNKKWNKLKI
jgi:histidinol-phosphatase (PHP family)